jgi:hypothetical protein
MRIVQPSQIRRPTNSDLDKPSQPVLIDHNNVAVARLPRLARQRIGIGRRDEPNLLGHRVPGHVSALQQFRVPLAPRSTHIPREHNEVAGLQGETRSRRGRGYLSRQQGDGYGIIREPEQFGDGGQVDNLVPGEDAVGPGDRAEVIEVLAMKLSV